MSPTQTIDQLSLPELRASIFAAEDRMRYFDAAESPQWTMEREARDANYRFWMDLRAELSRRYEVNLCPCGEDSPEGCAERPSRHCPGVPA